MFENRKIVIGLCAVLVVLLAVLVFFEHKYPEAGSELVRGLMSRT